MNIKKALVSMITPDFMVAWPVFIRSFLKENKWFDLPIVLLQIGLDDNQKETCRSFYPNIEFIEPKYNNYSGIHFNSTKKELRNTYYKLDVFSLYQYDRVVFIDMDTVILGNLHVLFDSDKDIGAARAYGFGRDKLRGDINSGVFVVNKKYLNKETYIGLIRTAERGFSSPDQATINTYFKDKIDHFFKVFNCEKRLWKGRRCRIFFDNDILMYQEGARIEPVKILHYVSQKPWNLIKEKNNMGFEEIEMLWWGYSDRKDEYEEMNRMIQEQPKKPDKISIRNAKFAKIGLRDLCNHVKDHIGTKIVIVEIGSFAGDSTEIFAQNFETVCSIDPWESGYDSADDASNPSLYDMKKVEDQFDELCKEFSNIVKMKGKSEDSVDDFDDGSLDMVYIDGNHQYQAVKEDIQRWIVKVKIGGFIAGHDWNSRHHPGVSKAVTEVLGSPDRTFRDSSWIKRIV